jgi:hypothetical protein
MTGLKMLVAAALLSTVSAVSAHAQAAFSEPKAFQAEYPNRDVLNGGTLTPAGRMGMELPDGAANVHAANDAYARMRSDSPSFCAQHYYSYDSATDTFLDNDGRRHPCQ